MVITTHLLELEVYVFAVQTKVCEYHSHLKYGHISLSSCVIMRFNKTLPLNYACDAVSHI